MAFRAEHRIKVQILKGLGSDQIFHLLADSDTSVVMKTLGLLRNLLSNKDHIDQIMNTNGKPIMQVRKRVCVFVLLNLTRGLRIANRDVPLFPILLPFFRTLPNCVTRARV